jgi:hypothetical protein
MHPRTLAALQRLEEADWFSRVGVKDATTAIVLSSWDEAVEHCGSNQWQNLCIEAANQLRLRILERSPERYEQWNDIAIELKKTTIPFVRRKIDATMREHNLPKVVEDMIQWDIGHICMEAEYADVFHPAFYASQAYWYTVGHFPCGWRGEFPKGMQIVY